MSPQGDAGGRDGRGEVRTWAGNDGKEHTEKVILADGLGPDLRWTTATVTRASRHGEDGTSAEAEPVYEEEPF